MLSHADSVWLAREYPELTVATHEITGLLEFTGAYDEQSGNFFIVNHQPVHEKLGTVLSGAFDIRIHGRLDNKALSLPRLYVTDVTHTPDQHFNQTDLSACLCSPLQEQDFLTPDFKFRKFFSELVVPFLYGQVFLSECGRWPWAEFAHGATGLLEAYAANEGRRKTQQCLNHLAKDSDWSRIKYVLLQDSQVHGDVQCLCRSQRSMKRCHPQAWRGLRVLKQDLRYWPVPLP